MVRDPLTDRRRRDTVRDAVFMIVVYAIVAIAALVAVWGVTAPLVEVYR